jgi:beta-lactamase class D
MSDLRFDRRLLLAAPLLLASPAMAEARTLCTLIADPTDGRALLEQGECRTRVTPASTFKIALSVIGFDAGLLLNSHSPEFPYREGYVDWGGENWKQPTDPTRWIKYSVVWYSQILAHALGQQRIADALRKFDYGNADMSGDPGQSNGLDRAWIGSSLKISPLEQAFFLGKLVDRQLPASREAMEETIKIIETRTTGDGWELHGKTGFAYPRGANGAQDLEHGFGWYVGWGVRDGRILVFARLNQDESAEAVSGGLRARDELIAEWPGLAAQAFASDSGSTSSQAGRRRHDP